MEPLIFRMASIGTRVAPMCCVIAPLSVLTTDEPRILSRREVFPWSTWPRTATIGVLMADSFDRDTASLCFSSTARI